MPSTAHCRHIKGKRTFAYQLLDASGAGLLNTFGFEARGLYLLLVSKYDKDGSAALQSARLISYSQFQAKYVDVCSTCDTPFTNTKIVDISRGVYCSHKCHNTARYI